MQIKKMTDTIKSNLKTLRKKDIIICLSIAFAVIMLTFSSVELLENNNSPPKDINTLSSSQSNYTEFEKRLSEILSKIDGAGNVNVLVNCRDNTNEIIGTVILFEGADIPETRIKLQLATQTVLGIEASQIKIFATKA